MDGLIYFDHNATSPLTRTARDAWVAAAEKYPANPSSPHRLGARAEAALAEARQSVAELLGCSAFDLVWASGATEANNAFYFHAARTAAASSREVWVSAIEHPSALAAAQRWFPGQVRWLPVTADGVLDLDALEDRLEDARPAWVSVMAANNETGVLQPWPEARELCRKFDVPFACDAAQWAGKEPAAGLGACEAAIGCAHKFGGPVGIGFIKVPAGFQALLVGGPQEDGRRAGTENLPSVLAMSAAWRERAASIEAGETENRRRWRDEFVAGLKAALPDIEILGERAPRLWNTVAALMPATPDCRRRWVVQLDKLGFAVSTGSACASGKEKPSHVLTAMGCDPVKADRMLRFSAGWETTEADWRALLEGVKAAFAELTASR